jgi:hypothetical protein
VALVVVAPLAVAVLPHRKAIEPRQRLGVAVLFATLPALVFVAPLAGAMPPHRDTVVVAVGEEGVGALVGTAVAGIGA